MASSSPGALINFMEWKQLLMNFRLGQIPEPGEPPRWPLFGSREWQLLANYSPLRAFVSNRITAA